MNDQPPRNRVLVLEDFPDTRSLLTRLLARCGYDVRPAETVAQALVLLEWEPDYLLLDLMLPDGDGMTVAFRARQTGRECWIALLTGAFAPPTEDAMRLGVALFRKPVDLKRLLEWMKDPAAEAGGATDVAPGVDDPDGCPA